MSVLRRVVSALPEVPSSGSASYRNTSVAYDYAIGGLPFFSAADDQHPLVRATAPYRKDQLDTSTNPGEQSLVGWWLRSQTSFHAGTGIVFEEPDPNDPNVQLRFADSAGIDPWTPGKVTLLKQANLQVATTGTTHITAGNDGTTDCWLQSDGTALKRVTAAGSSSTVTWGGSGTIVDLTDDGTNYYASDSVGIWKGTLAGGAGSKIWNTGNANVVVGWVKQRLVAGIGNSFYELTGSGPTLPTAKYTHPNTSWVWTAIAESPSAIYAAGYAGSRSAIYKFVLDTSGNVPTLTSGIITAELPVGEYVTALATYLGSFVAIGTNRGVRIGTINDAGDLSYGPLTVDFSKFSTPPSAPVYGLAGRDRFIYFTLSNGVAGKSGLGRIDLATQIAFGRFAWATDLQSHVTGTVRGVAVVGSTNRVVFAVDASGSYLEHATDLEPTGYLQTGNIRFHTLEPKLFKRVLTRCAPMAGAISVSVIDHVGVTTALASYSTPGQDVLDETSFPTTLGPQEYIALRYDFTRSSSDHTKGPEFRSYQLKALPGAKRQRIFVLPLLCFDWERDKFGAKTGVEGAALTRISALESLEEIGDVVSLQDLNAHPMSSRQVVIDDLKFVQTEPPKPFSGWGGRIDITLRTVD